MFIELKVRVNERIRVPQVRVVDENGNQLGVMPIEKAKQLALEKELDLVEIAPTSNPPVCKIMNYGKYLYQQSKKAHEVKKHQKIIRVKEVKFRPRINEHDYEFKKNNIIRFLQEGDKAKAAVTFRGREMTHREIGREILIRLTQDLADHAVVENSPRMEGNHMFVIFGSRK